MKTFTYKGEDKSAAGDVALVTGVSYKLDETDPHVKALVAQKLLVEVEEKQVNQAKAKAATEDTEAKKKKNPDTDKKPIKEKK